MPAISDAIEQSAWPAAAGVAVERLVEARPELRDRLETEARLRDAVVAVVAASRSMTKRLVADPTSIDVLADLDRRTACEAEDVAGLVRWKDDELLRIAARDLLGLDRLEEVGAGLSQLAADVLACALRLAGKRAGGLCVVGMGKLGGNELNYASDIDVLFVGEGDARRVMELARSCFRVDANLRPEGRQGPLTRSLASYEAYWDGWAEPWEFQALLKSRPVAGDTALGSEFAGAVEERLWGRRPFGADEIRAVRHLKARAEGEVRRRGSGDRELKLGPGGLRDIEFSVQLLQLVHGRADPALRVRSTLDALAELGRAGYVDERDASSLEGAYRFLRAVEHRLQLLDEQQVHTVPADDGARTRIARVLGYRDERQASALERFDEALRTHQTSVRSIHERLYFRPLLEAFAGADGAMTAEAIEARLSAFGFVDAERTRLALRELTRGLTRSSRLMQQLLPLLLEWLSDAPDPDQGLLGLRTLASGGHRASRLIEAFRESPETARRLCLLLGTSRLFARTLERFPELVRELGNDAWFSGRGRRDLLERIESSVGWRGSDDERRRALLRFKQVEELRIAARDVLGMATVEETAADLTDLAEAVLEAAISIVAPAVPLALVGMGRFGGGELSYASDLDVLVVHDEDGVREVQEAEGAAERLLRLVNGETPAARIFDLDAGLRPEGKQGPLARSLDGYAAYYGRWSQTWERQALVRARPVAGDATIAARFMALVEPHVWGELHDGEVREIRRMKARVERERIPRGEDPQFHLKLGRGSLSDVEWLAQLLQLRHGVRSSGTMAALAALVEQGALDSDDADVLRDAYRFCERTRNRLYLVRDAPGDALPTRADQLTKLARSLDGTASSLRDEYRRVTRRARVVFERLFYASG